MNPVLLVAAGMILGCVIPADLHPVCEEAIILYHEESSSIRNVVFVCNMVSSDNIPMVECLAATDEATPPPMTPFP